MNTIIKELNLLYLESHNNPDVIIEGLNLISKELNVGVEIINKAIFNCSKIKSDYNYIDIFNETSKILETESFKNYYKKIIADIDFYLNEICKSIKNNELSNKEKILNFKRNLYLLEIHLRALRDYK